MSRNLQEAKPRTGVGLFLTLDVGGVAKPFCPPTDPKDDACKYECVRKVCPDNPLVLGQEVTKGGRVLDHSYGMLGGAVESSAQEIERDPFCLGKELAREVAEEMSCLIERSLSVLNDEDLVTLLLWFQQLLTDIQQIPNSDFYEFRGIRVGQFLKDPVSEQLTPRGIFEVRTVQKKVPQVEGVILKKLGFAFQTNANQVRPYVRVVLQELGYGVYLE